MADVVIDTKTGSSIRKLEKAKVTKVNIKEALGLIDKINWGKIWKKGTILDAPSVRLDGQKSTAGKNANLQIQTNTKPSYTLAGVTIGDEFNDYNATQHLPVQTEAIKKAKAALVASLADGVNRHIVIRK